MTEPTRHSTALSIRTLRFAAVAAFAAALLIGGIRLKSFADSPAPTAVVSTVHIKDFGYIPGTLTVKTGTMVTFVNDDPVAHTVTSDPHGQFDSGDMGQNAKWSFTFTKAGTFKYLCTYHTYMKGTIIVKDAQ